VRGGGIGKVYMKVECHEDTKKQLIFKYLEPFPTDIPFPRRLLRSGSGYFLCLLRAEAHERFINKNAIIDC
jgi:hypothetical protein